MKDLKKSLKFAIISAVVWGIVYVTYKAGIPFAGYEIIDAIWAISGLGSLIVFPASVICMVISIPGAIREAEEERREAEEERRKAEQKKKDEEAQRTEKAQDIANARGYGKKIADKIKSDFPNYDRTIISICIENGSKTSNWDSKITVYLIGGNSKTYDTRPLMYDIDTCSSAAHAVVRELTKTKWNVYDRYKLENDGFRHSQNFKYCSGKVCISNESMDDCPTKQWRWAKQQEKDSYI